jgi:hypothetical protein
LGAAVAVRFDIASPTSSCTRTVTARAAARRLVRPSSLAGVEREKLEITEGLEDLLIFGPDELNDTRCGTCGLAPVLCCTGGRGAYVHVAMGTLVDAPSIRPTKHIFVGSKAPWFEITDDLPQFDEHAG